MLAEYVCVTATSVPAPSAATLVDAGTGPTLYGSESPACRAG